MDSNAVIEADVKFRDGKKWKIRWCVMRKLSPVADCLHLQLYRDSKDRYKQGMTKASLSLENFLGIETGFTLDKESNTVAIICRNLTVILAFESRERLIQWQMKISYNLGESTQFLIQISSTPAKAKLNTGPAKLHIQNHNFCLTSGVPPKLIGFWEIKQLRRYGVVDGKFCFEGGSLCGRGEGLYVFLTDECEEISWCMHMASEGRLIPKRRFMARNMSVIESPSRRYIQRPSDFHLPALGNHNSNLQDVHCQSFSNVYEWTSVNSTLETDSDEKLSSDYKFHSQLLNPQSHWTELSFRQFVEGLNFQQFENRSENNYEQCRVSTGGVEGIENYTEMRQPVSAKEERSENFIKAPERPPKPSKYKSHDGLGNAVINEIRPHFDYEEEHSNAGNLARKKVDALDNYDVPKTFCSKIQTKQINEHLCQCVESAVNAEKVDKESCQSSNYDIPPAAIPVTASCSCTSKIRVLTKSEERYQMQTCPCQHFAACWPYKLLQLAYCRRGNTIQNTTYFTKIEHTAPHTHNAKTNSLYAEVDLSKKTKRKLPTSETDQPTTNTKLRLSDSDTESNNNYTNLHFQHSLQYYENARDLTNVRTSPELEFDVPKKGEKCCDANSFNDEPSANGQENYIIMNPISFAHRDQTAVERSPRKNSSTQVERSRSVDKFLAFGRRRSDSASSAKSVPSTFHFRKNREPDRVELGQPPTEHANVASKAENEDANKPPAKACGNRDSSSSNDSGFSFGSLRLQGVDSVESEVPCQSLVRNNSFSAVHSASSFQANRSKSSDPLKDISFRFHNTGALISGSQIPICHKNVGGKKDLPTLRGEGISSIPYIDSQSTSSETSDISDYIETLSLSSHSSSDTASNAKTLHQASTVLRPRSGKEYEKANRVLLHYDADGSINKKQEENAP